MDNPSGQCRLKWNMLRLDARFIYLIMVEGKTVPVAQNTQCQMPVINLLETDVKEAVVA